MWAKIAEYALAIVDRLTAWAKERNDQNVGRQLQQTDDLKTSVERDHDAAQSRQDVAGLSDAALDAELRGRPTTDRR